MQISLLKKIVSEVGSGRKGVLCALVERHGVMPRSAGAAMWVGADGAICGSIGGGPLEHASVAEARDMLRHGEGVRVRDIEIGPGLSENTPRDGAVCGGNGKVYFELIAPNHELLVFGAGHVGQALARLASLCEFDVTVWDDRPELANAENLPGARVLCCPFGELAGAPGHGLVFHENCYAVAVSRSHEQDIEVLRLLAGRVLPYVGLIGSRGKKAFVDKQLIAEGVSADFLSSVRAPVGLPLGAESPAEVALSIMSEIVAVKNKADAAALRERVTASNDG